MRPISAHSSPGCPALGSRINLDKVQTMMESMGSKLSPGAQQLMNMVRFQQQVCRNMFLKHFKMVASKKKKQYIKFFF